MKDSLREMMVRLYDSRDIERLDKLWGVYKLMYTTKNQFIVDILIRGIESIENENSNIKDMVKDGNIFNELKRLTSMLDRFVDVGYEHYKESYVVSKENQTLISRLYDVIAKERGLSIDSYNRGIFDELPEHFEEVTERLIKEFNARGNN